MTREEGTPVTLVCGRWEEERKTFFFERTCQDLVFISPEGLGIKVDESTSNVKVLEVTGLFFGEQNVKSEESDTSLIIAIDESV